MGKILLLGVVLCFWVRFCKCKFNHNVDYCSIEPRHVFCEKSVSFGKECGPPEDIGFSPLLEEEKREVLHSHNTLRNNVAEGKEVGGVANRLQPPASNMRQMYWDDELEEASRLTTRRCLLKFRCVDCLRLERFQARELMYRREALNETYRDVPWFYIVERLYLDDFNRFNEFYIQNYRSLKKPNGYAYIIDAASYLVGCGKITYKAKETLFTLLVVCTYGPVDEDASSIYDIGRPCSKCPPLTSCSSKYPSLCGENNHEEILEQRAEISSTKDSPSTSGLPSTISTTFYTSDISNSSKSNLISDITDFSESNLTSDINDLNLTFEMVFIDENITIFTTEQTTVIPEIYTDEDKEKVCSGQDRLALDLCVYGVTYFLSTKLFPLL